MNRFPIAHLYIICTALLSLLSPIAVVGKMVQSASGLKYEIVSKGTGKAPVKGDRVSVYYSSKLADGTIINKYDTATGPSTFLLGEGDVIKGIDEAIALLKNGGKIHAEIPPALAYGSRKIGKIPAGSIITADIELIEFSPAFYQPLNKDTIIIQPGLKKLIAKESTAERAQITDDVAFTFTGYYINENGERRIFDKSASGQIMSFQLGGPDMITGLDQGLRTMHKGEKATFIISPELAYKNEKRGELPPNTTIFLDVELFSAKSPFFSIDSRDTIATASGLRYLIGKNGIGKQPGRNDIVSVRFVGYILDSSGNRIIFDRVPENKSWSYRVGSKNILPGLNEGMALMNMGAQYRLLIPPSLAFAERKIGIIAPNSTVYYDISLENITHMTFLTKGNYDTLTLPSGVKILKVNDLVSTRPNDSAIVVTKYTGYYMDSVGEPYIFENTQEEGKPVKFQLNSDELIPGFKEALKQLTEGQVAKIFIPSALAYGTRGVPGMIPPDKDLIFDLQVLKVANATQ